MRTERENAIKTAVWLTGQELLNKIRNPLFIPIAFLLQLISSLWFLLKPNHDPTLFYQVIGSLLIFLIPLYSAAIWQKEKKNRSDTLIFSSSYSSLIILVVKMAGLVIFWSTITFIVYFQVFLYLPLGNFSFGFFCAQGLFLFQIICIVSALGILFSIAFPSIFISYPVTTAVSFILFSVESFLPFKTLLAGFSQGFILPGIFLGFLCLSCFLLVISYVLILIRRRFRGKDTFPFMLWSSAFLLSVFLLFNISISWDISGKQRNNISEYSRILLKEELKQPLYITYYRTEDSSNSFVYREEVEKILRRISRISPLINLDIQSSGMVDEDIIWKERGASVTPYQDRKGVTKDFFSCLFLEYEDQEKLIPSILFPEECMFLVTRSVRKFIGKPIPQVVFMNGRDDLSFKQDFSLMLSVLKENFNVFTISSNENIAEQCNTLIISGQQTLTSLDIYHIDEFLKSGKNVIWSIGGLYIDPRSSDYGIEYSSSPANEYLENQWGIQLQEALVLDSKNISIEYSSAQGTISEPFPLWIYPSVWAMHPAAQRSSGLSYLWSSPLSIVKKNNIAVVPLHYTSREGWVFEIIFPLSPKDHLLPEETGQYSQSLLSVLSERKEGGRLLVLGSDLMFSNYIQMTGSMGNVNILADLVYQASGPEYSDLLDLKPEVETEMTLAPEIELSLIRFFLLIQVVVLPFIILLVGSVLSIKRMRKTR